MQDHPSSSTLPSNTNDSETWKAYWKEQGQPWRTEPAIDEARQQRLWSYYQGGVDIERGMYPFKGVRLSRADVEWLLATHENERGPVDWSDLGNRGIHVLEFVRLPAPEDSSTLRVTVYV